MEFKKPDKLFLKQKVMFRVCYALAPLVLVSVYLFGWRALALVAVVFAFGIASEAVFTWKGGKPVTSAVFVTSLIFVLSLPPLVPFWMAAIGIVTGVAIGKMAFGGFGQNTFNPAMMGRCFIYITFPVQMTNEWIEPLWGGAGGFGRWLSGPDALTRATPLELFREGDPLPLGRLFFGNTSGSLGETSILLILLGGIYLLYTGAASYRLAGSCLLGGIVLSGALHALGAPEIPSVPMTLISGSFLFGTVFVVTEPVSGPKTKAGQWFYGFIVGGLTVVLRGFSNFSEGIMFSVLLMNAFVPVIDQAVRELGRKKAAP